jgi:hypothetical protein
MLHKMIYIALTSSVDNRFLLTSNKKWKNFKTKNWS